MPKAIKRRIEANAEPVLAANTVLTVLGDVPLASVVQQVRYVPQNTLNGANTNSRLLSLYNRGTGANAVLVASLNLFVNVNLVDNISRVITLNAANANLNAGDVLEWESLTIGSNGIADPGGRIVVDVLPA